MQRYRKILSATLLSTRVDQNPGPVLRPLTKPRAKDEHTLGLWFSFDFGYGKDQVA